MTHHKTDGRSTYRREFPAVDYAHEYDIDIEKRDIFLFGREDYAHWESDLGEPGVEWTMANRFIKNIRILQSISSDPILIHMKTCGGDWIEGMAIYQAIKSCPTHVTILNYTHARSMSSLILQAADWRAMLPYSEFMYHDGTMSTDGTVKQYFTEAEQLKISHEQMMDIYLDSAEDAPEFEGKSRTQIKKFLRHQMDKKEEVYLNAKQTVNHGFADTVFGGDGNYNWESLRQGAL